MRKTIDRLLFKILLILFSIALILPFATTISLAATPQIYDLSTGAGFNLRFDGVDDTQFGTQFSVTVGDVNNNGKADLLIGNQDSDYNSRDSSGSVWVIFDSLLEQFTTTGHTINLSSSTSYNIRFDGEVAESGLGSSDGGHTIQVADINGNGRNDLILTAAYIPAAGLGHMHPGRVYVIYDNLLDGYSGTGNTVDLSTNTNYNLRYTQQAAYDSLGTEVYAKDIDGNGKLDLAIVAHSSDTTRGNAGSAYIIYDSLIDDYIGTGNIISLATTSNFNIRYYGPETDKMCNRINFADTNGNGKLDLIFQCYQSNLGGRSAGGAVFVIYDSLIDDYSGTANNVDLATSSNYNLRYDGPAATAYLGSTATIADLNGNSKNDLLLGAPLNSPSSRTYAGSVFVIYDSLIDDYSGTGNNIDLATTTNFNIRYDGETAQDFLGYSIYSADFDNNGSYDFLTSAPGTDNNSRSASGSVYVLYNSLISSYSGTANTVAVGSGNFSIRYDGQAANDNTGNTPTAIGDLNTDGKSDYLIVSNTTDFNSLTNSGSVYVVYNFPHTISRNSSYAIFTRDTPLSNAGTVSCPTSTTSITGVQINIDDWAPASLSWTDCSADDGSFNSRDEKFTCPLSASLFPEGKHTLYIRAKDTNDAHTAPLTHNTATFVIDKTSPLISELQIVKTSFVSGGNTYQLKPNNRMPSFSGMAIDSYRQGEIISSSGSKIIFDKVASGPEKIHLILKRLINGQNPNNTTAEYLTYLTQEYSLDNVKDTINDQKYANFYITAPFSLTDGYYMVKLALRDKAGNIYDYPAFFLSLNYRSRDEAVSSLPEPSLTSADSLQPGFESAQIRSTPSQLPTNQKAIRKNFLETVIEKTRIFFQRFFKRKFTTK